MLHMKLTLSRKVLRGILAHEKLRGKLHGFLGHDLDGFAFFKYVFFHLVLHLRNISVKKS